MDIESIDEAEDLIDKYRMVVAAKAIIREIAGEYGGKSAGFTIVDKDSCIQVPLFGMKDEILEGIENVLNEKYDKITSRLKEI